MAAVQRRAAEPVHSRAGEGKREGEGEGESERETRAGEGDGDREAQVCGHEAKDGDDVDRDYEGPGD